MAEEIRPKTKWWKGDFQAKVMGWHIIIRGLLYYDAATKQYWDAEGKKLTNDEVRSRHGIDPLHPVSLTQPPPTPEPRPAELAPPEPPQPAGKKITYKGVDYTPEDWALFGSGLWQADIAGAQSQWQQNWAQQQFDWQRQQAEQERADLQWRALEEGKQATANWKTRRFADLMNPPELAQVGLERGEEAKRWESMRQGLLEGATGPENWITRYQLENQINPYAPRTEGAGLQADISKDRAEVKRLKELVSMLKAGAKDPNSVWNEGNVAAAQSALDNAERRLIADQQEQVGITGVEAAKELGVPPSQIGMLGGRYLTNPDNPEFANLTLAEKRTLASVGLEMGSENIIRRPATPPAPSWLPQFVPGQVAGQPITRAPVTTPSGQQWTATPWSQRAGLAGYAQWSGGRTMEDIESQMAMMRPRTPQIASRWSPARQFA